MLNVLVSLRSLLVYDCKCVHLRANLSRAVTPQTNAMTEKLLLPSMHPHHTVPYIAHVGLESLEQGHNRLNTCGDRHIRARYAARYTRYSPSSQVVHFSVCEVYPLLTICNIEKSARQIVNLRCPTKLVPRCVHHFQQTWITLITYEGQRPAKMVIFQVYATRASIL